MLSKNLFHNAFVPWPWVSRVLCCAVSDRASTSHILSAYTYIWAIVYTHFHMLRLPIKPHSRSTMKEISQRPSHHENTTLSLTRYTVFAFRCVEHSPPWSTEPWLHFRVNPSFGLPCDHIEICPPLVQVDLVGLGISLRKVAPIYRYLGLEFLLYIRNNARMFCIGRSSLSRVCMCVHVSECDWYMCWFRVPPTNNEVRN